MNPCVFSRDRRYRYSLLHTWDELFESRLAAVIALNPSTADENALDPTLRRIRGFCMAQGLGGFCMLNLFAFRATDPNVMKAQIDPVGSANDRHILTWAKQAEIVIAAWGTHGAFQDRDRRVLRMLQRAKIPVFSWGTNRDRSPKHPLYLPKTSQLSPYVSPDFQLAGKSLA